MKIQTHGNEVEKFIISELQKLRAKSKNLPQNFEDEIFRLLKTRRFRKYSMCASLSERIQKAIAYNVSNNQPINITFLQGSYKLWRLDESPEADWAELFALMYYAEWVKPILSFYKPGVVFDFYVDDWIMEKLSNYRRDEIISYQNSFQKIMDFVMSYCSKNLHYKITTVSSQYSSEDEFWDKLRTAVEKWKHFEVIKLDKAAIEMIDLNYRPMPNEVLSALWREKNMQLHDAYSAMEDRLRYRKMEGKILAMPHHYTGSNDRLFVGSTKDSIIKYWIGVGALRLRNESFVPTILSPSQLANTEFSIYDVRIEGLSAENFKTIRILES